MPSKPKPSQTATGRVMTPKPESKSNSRIYDQNQFKREQLKRNKKPSKGSTGYKNAGYV